MRPSIVAEELRRTITDYLATTFALTDEREREALAAFLDDPKDGIFRGPYLRIRTPFRRADNAWRRHVEWIPTAPNGREFEPYLHQARSIERLSTLNKTAEPTLITTGTGSGKTESFLIPILDHCARERRAGRRGVKAVLLYPMNALATDQTLRVEAYLSQPPLEGVTAGLYIGDESDTRYPHVMTGREEMRRNPPDVLITNYKMLDLLLLREEDVQLWDGADLAYIVVDEFHTYDGAQGTDVAMLLRRLASAVGAARPGRPLGSICPVATSATLGQDLAAGSVGSLTTGAATAANPMLDVAEKVFATSFPPESIIGEDRLTVSEFVDPVPDYTLPFPSAAQLAATADPARDPAAIDEISMLVLGVAGLTPRQLGKKLKSHALTAAVLEILGDGPGRSDRDRRAAAHQGRVLLGRDAARPAAGGRRGAGPADRPVRGRARSGRGRAGRRAVRLHRVASVGAGGAAGAAAGEVRSGIRLGRHRAGGQRRRADGRLGPARSGR